MPDSHIHQHCITNFPAFSQIFVDIFINIFLLIFPDLAVTVGEHIEFFHNNGSGVGAASKPFNELSAITYDSVYETLYFCDNKHEDITIFSYKLDPSKDFQPLLERKFSENVQGIAFDPMIETLFWTDGKTKSINWMSLMPGSNPDHVSNVLMNFTNGEEPKAITVDSCRGYVFIFHFTYEIMNFILYLIFFQIYLLD